MAIEDMIGQIYGINTALPLNYGGLYNQQFGPIYGYGQSQGNNMAQLGGQSMNLYGNLAGQQASMYQSELPIQYDMAKFNALAPALSGLLGQGGFGGLNISPVNMNFSRPDVMSGYQGAVDRAYKEGRGYDQWMGDYFNRQDKQMPTMPKPPAAAPAPAPAPAPAAPMPVQTGAPRAFKTGGEMLPYYPPAGVNKPGMAQPIPPNYMPKWANSSNYNMDVPQPGQMYSPKSR